MKFRNTILVSFFLLAVLTIGTVSAGDDTNDLLTVDDAQEDIVNAPVEKIKDDTSSINESDFNVEYIESDENNPITGYDDDLFILKYTPIEGNLTAYVDNMEVYNNHIYETGSDYLNSTDLSITAHGSYHITVKFITDDNQYDIADFYAYYNDTNTNSNVNDSINTTDSINDTAYSINATDSINSTITLITDAKVVLSKNTFTYNAKVQKPLVTSIGGLVLKRGIDYTVKYSTASPKNVGTYTVTVVGIGSYSGTAKATYKINKAANPLKIKAKTAAVKFSKLKNKAQQVEVSKVIKFTKKGQGTLVYKKASENKKITINKKTGKVIIKKGLKKGTYKVKVKVKAKGNSNYKASAFKTVTFKIKVK